MAGLWPQPCSLWQGRALALLRLICVLSPATGALPWDNTVGLSPLEQFEVVKGNFSRTFLRVGYHKIAEIPAGARNISIQETKKSQNYLALQSQHGVSIINGNWVIDRPGIYTALGTHLTYRRPNEIRSRNGESVTAAGPLTEDLHVYLIYQQPYPSVQYEYSIRLKKPHLPPEPVTPSAVLPLATSSSSWGNTEAFLGQPDDRISPVCPGSVAPPSSTSPRRCPESIVVRCPKHDNWLSFDVGGVETLDLSYLDDDSNSKRSIIKEESHYSQAPSEPRLNSESQATYIWTKTGHTECSTTCGTGKRQVVWECVEKDSQTAVPADFCHPATETTQREEDCNTQSCPAYWDVGEWSECSRKCGPGTQHRQVICRQVTHVHASGTETSVTVTPERCDSSDKPVTQSTCQLKICSQWEIRSEWSPCSAPCGVGQRTREVVCVSNQGDVDDDQECNMNLKPDTIQNCDMGLCARSWFISLWSQRCSAECGRGNRTRSVVCLMDHVTNLPLDSCEGERPPEMTSCDSGPCRNRLEWYTGPWGQCSAECGNGTQTRSVACIFNSDGQMEVVEQLTCSSLSKPITAQPCRLKPCGAQWYVTEWSACSRSCNTGFRVREVRCLADNIVPSDGCDPNLTPESREECNKQACVAEIDPLCSDKYHNCMLVAQARLCVYSYYGSVCCTSCSRAQKTHTNSFQNNYVRR